MIDLAFTSVDEQGVHFETGVSVTFRFLRNTARSPRMGPRFGQDIEPAGRYMIHNEDPGQVASGWETGVVAFENPLVIRLSLDDDVYGPRGWKARLQDVFGETGAELSLRLIAEGWDGIVTVGEFTDRKGRVHRDTREIVDLRPVALTKNPYYHGSKTPLKVGTIIRPKKDGYVRQQWEDGAEDNWVERALEAGRPKDKLSRLESVFLLKIDYPMEGNDGFLFDCAGGYGNYVYEVEPIGRVEESDLRWYTAAAYFKTELGRKRAISAYWRGKPAGFMVECRTPAARVLRRVGGSAKPNPPLGAPWLTPRLEARLRDLERRHINERTRMCGHERGLLVCESAPDEALDLVLDSSGIPGELMHGVVLHLGAPGGWPNVDPGKLRKPYFHWWIELGDGTIVDVASSQFGQRSPLVIPPGHPMQRLYVPEDPEADELPSGYAPLLIDRHKALENPATPFADFLRELPSFLRSRPALAAIDGMPTRNGDNPWLGGGCFVLAEALADFLGPGAIPVDIVDDGLGVHSVVEAGGPSGSVWIDGAGAFQPSMAAKIFSGMTGIEKHERTADRGRVWKLLSALRRRFGSVRPA